MVHYRSFEWVCGPKEDVWLVKCVGGLTVTMGFVQLRSGTSEEGLATARRIGIGAAATFGAIDLVYGCAGRISKIYLLEAAIEAALLAAWMATRHSRRGTGEPQSPPRGWGKRQIHRRP